MPIYPGADGAALHYDVGPPHGQAVIALAGGAARHPEYLDDLAGLGEQQWLVVPHLRGVGRSPLPDPVELASYWRMADDLERLRVHLGLERVVLLGHSAGTRLALSYAAQFPDRLAGLVLITPPAGILPGVQADAEDLVQRRRGDPVFDAAVAAWSAGPEGTDDAAFTAWQHLVAPMSYARWGEAEQAHAAIGSYSFAANRAYFSVDPPADLPARLAGVAAPVLVLAGADDCGPGRAPATALARLFPAGELAIIEECGHYPWVEQPAAFRRVADQFLGARLTRSDG